MIDRAEASSILRESTVTVFVNSVAGGGRARSCLPQIQKLFEAFRIHAQIVMTNSAAELESCAKNAISQGRRALFAMGGDGTFQALANAAFGADALLGVLPIGGGNDLGNALRERSVPLAPRSISLHRVSTTSAGELHTPRSPHRLSGGPGHLLGSESAAGSGVEFSDLWCRCETGSRRDPRRRVAPRGPDRRYRYARSVATTAATDGQR